MHAAVSRSVLHGAPVSLTPSLSRVLALSLCACVSRSLARCFFSSHLLSSPACYRRAKCIAFKAKPQQPKKGARKRARHPTPHAYFNAAPLPSCAWLTLCFMYSSAGPYIRRPPVKSTLGTAMVHSYCFCDPSMNTVGVKCRYFVVETCFATPKTYLKSQVA